MHALEQEISTLPDITHTKSEILERAKKHLADLSSQKEQISNRNLQILGGQGEKTSVWFAPDELLLFYTNELLGWYKDSFKNNTEHEIFHFLKSFALKDLSSLDSIINEALFQEKMLDGGTVEDEVRYFIRFVLAGPELMEHMQRALADTQRTVSDIF